MKGRRQDKDTANDQMTAFSLASVPHPPLYSSIRNNAEPQIIAVAVANLVPTVVDIEKVLTVGF